MKNQPQPVLILLGPSGAGKSTLSAWICEDLCLLHIEVDRFPEGDGIDLADLRCQWDAFWLRAKPKALASEVRSRAQSAGRFGIVLSFPSGVVLSSDHLAACKKSGISVIVTYGTRAECLSAFINREKGLNRGLTAEHWRQNNDDAHEQFSGPAYAPYRLSAFKGGQFRDRTALVEEIRQRAGLTSARSSGVISQGSG